MIQTTLVNDNCFLKARELSLPVTITGARTFTMPSATRPELTTHHRVTFDLQEQPHEFSCSCEAAEHGRPCWAAARALDVLVSLAALGIVVGEWAGGFEGDEAPAYDSTRDEEVEHAIQFDGPLPSSEAWSGRFEHLTRVRRPEQEGDPDALLVPARKPYKPVERVKGFQI